ncbi:MAG: PepSY domain-containing protein, partial [Variovorax sp.]|nr:PepSY domain-containing protein [Variovorax sp.]
MGSAERASAADAGTRPSRFHAVAWRWHFYAGLYVVPFLLMLALTGAVMVFHTGFQTRFGFTVHVTPQAAVQPVSAQAQAVLELRSGAQLIEYIAPRAPDQASWFVVKRDGLTEAVAV